MKGPYDVLFRGMKVLIVGLNPSVAAAQAGIFFAGLTNQFWRLITLSGLVGEAPNGDADVHALKRHDIGITNLCSKVTSDSRDLTAFDFAAGRFALNQKIKQYQPEVVAFVGKRTYDGYFGRECHKGYGYKGRSTYGAKHFMLPSTSGRFAEMTFDDKLSIFKRLAAFIKGKP